LKKKNNEAPTKVLPQVGQEVENISICKYQQEFGLDIINLALVHIFNFLKQY